MGYRPFLLYDEPPGPEGVPASPVHWELDLLRGVAVAMMILYHALYDLDYFSGPDIVDVRSGIWPSFALATASIFLLLVGVSLRISSARTRISGGDFLRRSIRRGVVIFSWGVAVTLATFLLLEEGYVLFGILHAIGATIVLSIPFIRRPLLALLLGLATISAGIFLRQFSFETPWFIWLGFVPSGFYLWGAERAQREDPTLQGGDESGALPHFSRNL